MTGDDRDDFAAKLDVNFAFAHWVETNVHAHKMTDYAIVTVSLKPHGGIPGDITDAQMDALADIAEAVQLRRAPRQKHEQKHRAGRCREISAL